ncbi:hypothetical protein CLF_113085 [Clonorchis sinensis]|uniref:Uncharacterized protein n=1 Tax=Clonorchis sinensis TaxID=79923 RepID=G7YXL4_CLOSI|nr:hypothetical protein CLF_113085 [Clonorchis sinensis]
MISRLIAARNNLDIWFHRTRSNDRQTLALNCCTQTTEDSCIFRSIFWARPVNSHLCASLQILVQNIPTCKMNWPAVRSVRHLKATLLCVSLLLETETAQCPAVVPGELLESRNHSDDEDCWEVEWEPVKGAELSSSELFYMLFDSTSSSTDLIAARNAMQVTSDRDGARRPLKHRTISSLQNGIILTGTHRVQRETSILQREEPPVLRNLRRKGWSPDKYSDNHTASKLEQGEKTSRMELPDRGLSHKKVMRKPRGISLVSVASEVLSGIVLGWLTHYREVTTGRAISDVRVGAYSKPSLEFTTFTVISQGCPVSSFLVNCAVDVLLKRSEPAFETSGVEMLSGLSLTDIEYAGDIAHIGSDPS